MYRYDRHYVEEIERYFFSESLCILCELRVSTFFSDTEAALKHFHKKCKIFFLFNVLNKDKTKPPCLKQSPLSMMTMIIFPLTPCATVSFTSLCASFSHLFSSREIFNNAHTRSTRIPLSPPLLCFKQTQA